MKRNEIIMIITYGSLFVGAMIGGAICAAGLIEYAYLGDKIFGEYLYNIGGIIMLVCGPLYAIILFAQMNGLILRDDN